MNYELIAICDGLKMRSLTSTTSLLRGPSRKIPQERHEYKKRYQDKMSLTSYESHKRKFYSHFNS